MAFFHAGGPTLLYQRHTLINSYLQDIFITYIPFYSPLPRPFQLLGVFLNSAIYHSIFYYPLRHDFPIIQHLCFWVGSGVACVLERYFFHVTGKRVRGNWGRLWTFGVLLLVSTPLVQYCWRFGWAAEARKAGMESADFAPVYLLYRALGGRKLGEQKV
jgi:hypothetical protein